MPESPRVNGENVDPALPFRVPRWLAPALSFAVLLLTLALLHHALAGYHLRDVLEIARRFSWPAGVASVVAMLGSYSLLVAYDALALRYVGQRVPLPRVTLASFLAFAIGHNIGFATLSGAAIRMRVYGAVGLQASQVAVISGFCMVTTAVGVLGLVGLVMLVDARSAAHVLHLPQATLPWLALLMLGLLAAYLLLAALRRRPVKLGAWRLRVPGPRLALAQLFVAALDLVLAAACFAALLPPEVPFTAVLGAYLIAIVAALVSNVPGGIGVFESVMVLALPMVPTPALLAALVGYRVVYHLLPLLVATVALVLHEAWLYRQRVRAAAGVARGWLSALAPHALGALVLLTAGVLLLSGATPAVGPRVEMLARYVPLPVIEVSHLLGSVAGLGLLVLSRALMRRVKLARQVTLLLLLAGAGFSLLKGLDYEECLALLAVAALLYASGDAFYRRAALVENRTSLRWLGGVAMIVGVVTWVGFLAHRNVRYSNDLWWTFAFDGDAPRMLRATLVIALLTVALLVHRGLMPGASVAAVAADADAMKAVEPVVAQAPRASAALALLGDKRLLLHPAGDAFLMYQLSGRSWIAMGDPVLATGTLARCAADLAWNFRELSDEHGGWTVFYQVTPEYLPVYIDLGLALLKLGEEARVDLGSFSLEGRSRAEFRTARRRAEREGASFEVLALPHDGGRLAELAAVSDAWLAGKAGGEKSFSVGRFDPAYIGRFPVAVVRREGRIVAFASLWCGGQRRELSVDLMRHAAGAPPGVMDYLFAETMLWGKSQGYEWFNLGMAPLSGLESHYLAPVWNRFGSFVSDVGRHLYNFEGLRRYKQKFDPVWEPRYLAAPGGLVLPRVLVDVASLISGGLRKVVVK